MNSLKKIYLASFCFIVLCTLAIVQPALAQSAPGVTVTQTSTDVTFNGAGFTSGFANNSVSLDIASTTHATSTYSRLITVNPTIGTFTKQLINNVSGVPPLIVGDTYAYDIKNASASTTVLYHGTFIFTGAASSPNSVTLTPNQNTPSANQGNCKESSQSEYCLLAPLPGFDGGKFVASPTKNNFGDYINLMIRITIGLAAVIAVVMIVFGGIQWMSTDSVGGKGEGKERILNAMWGMLLILGAYLILNTLNPNLVNINIGIESISVAAVDLEPTIVTVNGKQVYSDSTGKIITIDGKTPAVGDAWPLVGSSMVAVRSQLTAIGVAIPSPECKTVGERNCTSTYFTQATAQKFVSRITSLKTNCHCTVTVTGASEYWLHQTHTPDAAIADLRASDANLNTYIYGKTIFPNDGIVHKTSLGGFLAERAGQTSNTSAVHWHANFY